MLNNTYPEYRHLIPGLVGKLERYAKHHEHPGEFLFALLSGNLNAAFGLGDNDERATIFVTLEYCSTELPKECRGSEERVNSWLGKLNHSLTKS